MARIDLEHSEQLSEDLFNLRPQPGTPPHPQPFSREGRRETRCGTVAVMRIKDHYPHMRISAHNRRGGLIAFWRKNLW